MKRDKLILGTVQFGLDYGVNNKEGKPNQEKVNEILEFAYQSGIKFLDSAEAYGNAHKVIGEYHKNTEKPKFEVITKLPNELNDVNVEKRINTYCKELQVDRINSLMFHSFESYKTNKKKLNNLTQLKKQGLIKYLGVSIYTDNEFREVIHDKNIDIIQCPFNILDNLNLRGELIKQAKSKGKIIHTRSVFLQGLFFIPLEDSNSIVKALQNELTYVHHVVTENKISISELALNYGLQQDLIDGVLIGVDNLQQLKQNIKEAGNQLSEKIIKSINQIQVKNPDLLNPSLWTK